MAKRLTAFVLVFLLALSIAPFVSAQDSACYNLSAEDCEVITSAATNTYTLTSFNHNFSVDIDVTGLEVLAMLSPEIPQAITFNVAGGGPFVIQPGAEVPVQLALDMLVNAQMGADSISDQSVAVALVGDYFYLPGQGEVVGLPISAFEDGEVPVIGDVPSGEDVTNLGDLLGIDLSTMNPTGSDIGYAVDYTRLADEELMGQTVYPFQMTIDVDAILNSPEVLAAINSLSGLMGSGADADPTTAMMVQLIPTLLAGVESDVMVTQYVGATDNFIHKLTFDFGFAIDLGVLTGAAAGGSTSEIPPVNIDLTFDVELSDINQVSSVEAPADARLLSEEEARAMLDQGMGALQGLGGMGF